MQSNFKTFTGESIDQERLKGARMSVYFRWLFIAMLVFTVTMQLISGYRAESIHSFRLILIYLIANFGLWYAVRKKYDPPFVGYLSAILDVGIITFHLYYLSVHFDPVASAAAATTFLFPIIFLLYTFRLDRSLLLFVVLFSVVLFNVNYYIQYSSAEEQFGISLSLSPISQMFKSIYILFIGFLCIYMQYSISEFIQKQVAEAAEKARLDERIKMEEQKNLHARELIEQEKRMNRQLEHLVEERTLELTRANTQLINLQKENLQSQFEVLKQQVNPHFLFNSLNVLSSLIRIDPALAETFTEKLSKVYRYVLEHKDKDLVSLSTELEFLTAYLFLLEIRFMNKIVIDLGIDRKYYDLQIPPIAIQLVIENAIKHNTFSRAEPLKIEIFVDESLNLNIVNNLRLRETRFASTGVGIENITRRYGLVSARRPEFIKTDDFFVARLPLLKPELNR